MVLWCEGPSAVVALLNLTYGSRMRLFHEALGEIIIEALCLWILYACTKIDRLLKSNVC